MPDIFPKLKILNPWTVYQLLVELNIHSPYDPEIPRVGIFPREVKAYIHTKLVHEFTAALFIIAPNWKQLANDG